MLPSKWQTPSTFPMKLDTSPSYSQLHLMSHFPLGQFLDHNMAKQQLGLFGWGLGMLASSFEDQGGVLPLAWEETASPPAWMDSLLALWGPRRPPGSPSKVCGAELSTRRVFTQHHWPAWEKSAKWASQQDLQIKAIPLQRWLLPHHLFVWSCHVQRSRSPP